MKILLYRWEAFGELPLYRALQRNGCEVICYNRKIENQLADERFLTELVLKLIEEKIEAVVSFNFIPLLSMGCRAARIIYLTWVYSSPDYGLYCEEILKDHNFTFCFDRMEVERLKLSSAPHVYHLPLAADVETFQNCIKAKGRKKADISFVGNLYTDENYYFAQIRNLPEYARGYVNGLCEAQMRLYGGDLITGMLPENVLDQFREVVSFQMNENYFLSFEQFITDILQKKVTVMERAYLLKSLSEQFEVTLYTGSDASGLPKVKKNGRVHYYDEMPSVFAGSAINLNITLRSILTGIPLRVVDVAACRGFLISNYQEELADYFRIGEEIEVFTSKEELEDKCGYYLKHETKRQKIAERGFERVKRDFTFEERVRFMLDRIDEERK